MGARQTEPDACRRGAAGLDLRMHVPSERRRVAGERLYPDDLGALLVQLCSVLLMCLLLALWWLGVVLATVVISRCFKTAIAQNLA